jgi:hypothetical protein
MCADISSVVICARNRIENQSPHNGAYCYTNSHSDSYSTIPLESDPGCLRICAWQWSIADTNTRADQYTSTYGHEYTPAHCNANKDAAPDSDTAFDKHAHEDARFDSDAAFDKDTHEDTHKDAAPDSDAAFDKDAYKDAAPDSDCSSTH